MTKDEFDRLIQLRKVFDDESVILPRAGDNGIFNLSSVSSRDKFILDVTRKSRIELSKFKIQTRNGITKMPLVRVEFKASPHINPDGTRIGRNHIHVYRETDGDTGNLAWAYDIDSFFNERLADNGSEFMSVFELFCKYCNIVTDHVQGAL